MVGAALPEQTSKDFTNALLRHAKEIRFHLLSLEFHARALIHFCRRFVSCLRELALSLCNPFPGVS
jgi:hypothetical protein